MINKSLKKSRNKNFQNLMKLKMQHTKIHGTQGKQYKEKSLQHRVERSQINDFVLHLETLENQEQTKPSRSKEGALRLGKKSQTKQKQNDTTMMKDNFTILRTNERANIKSKFLKK